MSLDGDWELAKGSLTTVTASAYQHMAPVPGLVEMATPPVTDVGTSRTPNEAYWYRRTISVPDKCPPRATLHILKAAYGTRVFLNGVPLRDDKGRLDHNNSFASSRFDCTPALLGNGAPNVLEIRVGERKTLPADVPNGHDFEKIVYQPGIYDSVQLISSGTPSINDIQIAPRLQSSTVEVQLSLGLTGESDVPVSCTIREARSRRIAGELRTSVSAKTSSPTLTIPIHEPHPWTPEDPFLYELELATAGDTNQTRFAMRSFSFDDTTGRAMLNGKPYFMRGTNVCIFRFFEDALRQQRPWDRKWVRQLHQAFKSMHWNSIRYCIGFPPEFWYDIADEEGFLIQDEFPIWEGTRPIVTRPQQLAEMYKEWMRDHWNHPCVVLWDAQNETVTTVTGAAIRLARTEDLSNRPWDNGWSAARQPGDSFEVHPYIFNSFDALLADLEDVTPQFVGSPQKNTGGNAQIINEYGWLWLNRDGTPCTLTRRVYDRLLGTTATADQRRDFYAYTLAAETEFWRATRRYAAVMHFCGLGYDRPGGQTSDNFADLEKLEFEYGFGTRVRDSYSPIGACVQRFSSRFATGREYTFPVSIINDLPEAVTVQLSLKLQKDGNDMWTSASQSVNIAGLGQVISSFDIQMPEVTGHYQIIAEVTHPDSQLLAQPLMVTSVRDVELVSSASMGLAVGCRATASSWQVDGRLKRFSSAPGRAFDGDPSTRWSSEFSDPQWLTVDLDKPQTFSRAQILWERASARAYRIQVSDDNKEWRDVYSVSDCNGGQEELRFPPVTARWVRLYGEQRATEFGYSIYELRLLP